MRISDWSSDVCSSDLTRSLGKTLAPHTRVNALCVGSMSPDGQEAEIHRGLGLAERNAIKRFGAADEAVGAAILLAGEGSSYTTGSTIFCEGGRVGPISCAPIRSVQKILHQSRVWGCALTNPP